MFKKMLYAVALIIATNIFCVRESDSLYKIFDITNVAYERNLASLNAAAQKHFLRKPGLERWELDARGEAQRTQLMPLLYDIGLVASQMPQSRSYDYALFMGATGSTMEARKNFLEKLIQDGISFKETVILVGERPLDEGVEAEYMAYGKTEADIAEYIFKDFKHPHTIVKTPMLATREGKLYRPTTVDTVKTWLANDPRPGTVLVISNNPFIQRQTNVTAAQLSKVFSVEGCGSAAHENTAIAVYLDELARTIYSEMPQAK